MWHLHWLWEGGDWSTAEQQRCCLFEPLAGWLTGWLANWSRWSYDSASCVLIILYESVSGQTVFCQRLSALGGACWVRCWRFSLRKERVEGKKSVWDSCLKAMCERFSLEEDRWGFSIQTYKWHFVFCFLTTLEPCFVQARVRGGFPVHAQVKAASIPVSTVIGLGSDRSLGPTRGANSQMEWAGNYFRGFFFFLNTSTKHKMFPFILVKLTLHIYQGADVGAAHRVGHLTGDRVSKVRVVHGHLKAVPICFRDRHSSFRPPWTHE